MEQNSTKPVVTSSLITEQVEKAPAATREAYNRWLVLMLERLDQASEQGSEELAGFMFAYSQLGNIMCRRYSDNH